MKKTDLAWAAGFFDGEGCSTSGLTNHGTTTRIRLIIGQNDRRPLDRFMKIFNIGSINGPYPGQGNSKPFYKWETGARADVFKVMELMWPYLSEPKKEQWKRDLAKLARLKEELENDRVRIEG